MILKYSMFKIQFYFFPESNKNVGSSVNMLIWELIKSRCINLKRISSYSSTWQLVAGPGVMLPEVKYSGFQFVPHSLLKVKLSLVSFLLALVTNCWVLDPSLPLLSFSIALLPTLGVKLAEAACLWNLDSTQRLNSFTAYCLGLVFLSGLCLWSPFGIYLCFLAFFHFSEYVATGLGNPRNLSFDSYLVSQGKGLHPLFLGSFQRFRNLEDPSPMLRKIPK